MSTFLRKHPNGAYHLYHALEAPGIQESLPPAKLLLDPAYKS